ncbi:MAG: endo alpha-1,4 polygalactosaminidase [Acidimicrobiia bacterium]|nr:endo alpha-1,4 polygalactosaminidase [Acidimicrobiia bacterium]
MAIAIGCALGPAGPVAADSSRASHGTIVVRAASSGGGPRATRHWSPKQSTTWQWQLTGRVDRRVDAAVYDIDLVDNSARVVAALHDRGHRVICYVSVGSYERWRPDAARFPASVLGRSNGWPGERWLDIRRISLLAPILRARFDLCKRRGFDAVEPDNLDGYANRTGFPLSAHDQLMFNRWIARLAHARGLGVALKNDGEQAAVLEPSFDFAVVEECYEYDECGLFRPFVRAGKAVLHVEYDTRTSQFCAVTAPMGFSSMRKHWALGPWRKPC